MSKSPAFQWYPKDYLCSARVSMMSLEEEGAYIRALCYCWLHGSIPADPVRLAQLIGKGGSILVATVVQECFIPNPNDPSTMIHERLEEEREKQEEWRKKSAEGGKKSAQTRQAKKLQSMKGGSQMVATNRQPKGNSSSSSSFKEENNIDVSIVGAPQDAPPTPKRASRLPDTFMLTQDMRKWASERTPEIDVITETEKFVNHWRAKAGKDATKHDWIATWRNWMLKAEDFRHKGNGTPKPKPKLKSVEEVVAEREKAMQIGARPGQ